MGSVPAHSGPGPYGLPVAGLTTDPLSNACSAVNRPHSALASSRVNGRTRVSTGVISEPAGISRITSTRYGR